ncbi:putative Flagellum attachment zone protein 19 [Trypanosoma cruzi]|nr:putative Flagellum attachment zone protein 19 [Trypanosoma cruzi]
MLKDRFAHLRIVDSDSDSDDAQAVRQHNLASLNKPTYKSSMETTEAFPTAAAAAPTSPFSFPIAANVKKDIASLAAPAGEPGGSSSHTPKAAFLNEPPSMMRGSSWKRSSDKEIQSVRLGGGSVNSFAAASTSGSERRKVQQCERSELPDASSAVPSGLRPLSVSEGCEEGTRVEEKQVTPQGDAEMAAATSEKAEEWEEGLEETHQMETVEEPPTQMTEPMAVVGSKETEELRIVATDLSEPLPAPADDAGRAAVKRFLEERYWEKTHGYDPFKRRMPLFVAIEHCSPKNVPVRSNLPERNALEANPEVVRAEEPCQHEIEQNYPDSEGVGKFLDEELAVASRDDRLLKEGSEGMAGPAPNMASVVSVDDDHAGDLLSSTQPAESGEIRGAFRKDQGEAYEEGSQMGDPIITDENVLQEEAASEMRTSATNVKKEMEGGEKEERASFMEGSQPHLPGQVDDASKVLLSSKAALSSPGKIQENEYAESLKLDENNQRSIRSNVSNFIVESDQKGQSERGPNEEIFLAKEELLMNDGINVDSLREKREVQSANESAVQQNSKASNKSEEPLQTSELTVESLRKFNARGFEGTHWERYNEGEEYTDSSRYKTCFSPGTTDAGSFRMGKGLPRRFAGYNDCGGASSRRQELAIPPFHRRLILDMEEKFRREKRSMEHSLNEYTFHPRTTCTPRGHLPQRRRNPTNGGSTESPCQSLAMTPARSSARHKVLEEPLPTFKPEISKFARETQRPKIPYHERLYSPRPSPAQAGPGGALNGTSPHLSPRMVELLDGATPPLFRPEISSMAKAIENGAPFYERLYQVKADVEPSREGKSLLQSPPISPRRPTRPIQLSPRLLERPAPPAETLPYSFHPEISPRAKAMENGAPFYERLYQVKADVEPSREGKSLLQSPPISPRRPTRPIQLSPRLLERPAPPAETIPYSFHPQISPRAMSMESHGPVYERLYPIKDERSAILQRQEKKFEDFLASFQPSIAERSNGTNVDSRVMGRDVVRRLTEHRERSQRYVDPSLTFHPFITQKARDLKNENSAALP